MKSELPKVLHEIDGKPMICRLLDTLVPMKFDRLIAVIGFKGEQVQEALRDYPVEFVWQREQLGTGHAVKMA
ncbi:NTP transferase domain-containing protein, partial [candidate division GN15 bacterium]|nr:NTP transferase domain-containing protein [candidate division GN15 bacterium]